MPSVSGHVDLPGLLIHPPVQHLLLSVHLGAMLLSHSHVGLDAALGGQNAALWLVQALQAGRG